MLYQVLLTQIKYKEMFEWFEKYREQMFKEWTRKKLFQLEVQSIKECSSALTNVKKKMKTELHGMMEKK